MANRPLSLAAGLSLAGAFLFTPLGAQADAADWDARLAQADTLRAEGKQRLEAADAVLARAKAACQHKFQVNACIKEAEDKHLLVRRENRQHEIEADRIEHAVKSEQRDARMAEKTERRTNRTAELPQRAAENAAAAQEASGLRQAKQQDKDAEAAARLQKNAEQQAAHQRKLAEHEARVAKKKARAEAKAAKAARKKAESTAPADQSAKD
jgi:hypothetical protein